MIKTEKNIKLKELREKVFQKRKLINEETEALKNLENELKNMENSSEYPMLLFMVDHTIPMWDDPCDWEFEGIYYFPDSDETRRIITSRRDQLLPNAIDLREDFKNLGMPERVWPGDAYYEYSDIIEKAVSTLRPFAQTFYGIAEENYKAALPAPQMKLYSFLGYVTKAFFDTEEELTEYTKNHDTRFGDISTVEFLGNVLGHTDVIRIINKNGTERIVTAINKNIYAVYNPDSEWVNLHGDLSAIYEAFRDRGISFADDTYAKTDTKHFYMQPKDNK